jgi:ribosomal protein S12 methylthiotransferase accessory factor
VERPEVKPATGLAAALEARSGAAGTPTVVPLGRTDVTGGDDPYAAQRPHANVHVAPDAVLVGPLGGGACGLCLAMRWQRLRPTAERDALETGAGEGAVRTPGEWPLPTDFVADATWALLGTAGKDGDTHDGRATVHRLDLATLRVETVTLLPDAHCPAHGSPSYRSSAGLRARPKPAGTGTRLRAANAYDLPVGALVNPVCGVLGPGAFPDLAAPTTAAVGGRFLDRGRDGLNDIDWSGKADSFAASHDLGLLEGLERYAGLRQRHDRAPVRASLADLRARGEHALDPRDCGEYPDATYDSDPVLRRFSPEAEIAWVHGHSLRDDRPILVPARSAYYGQRSTSDDFVFECSNGCATGSCLEEAVLHGLLELIERDAFLLGWYSGQPQVGIHPETLPVRGARTLLDRAALHGYDVRLVDSRVDLSVPVVTAVAMRRDGGPGTISFAAGAALDPAAAAVAALSEVLTYIAHLRGDAEVRRDEVTGLAEDFARVRSLRDHALLYAHPDSAAHARRFLEPARMLAYGEVYDDPAPTTDLRQDLDRVCGEIVGAGCDVIVVDQTTPEQARLGLTTVRTIAPGLLPIDFGWGRQRALAMPRLREAHHRAGLAKRDLTDDDLHRVPHPFC